MDELVFPVFSYISFCFKQLDRVKCSVFANRRHIILKFVKKGLCKIFGRGNDPFEKIHVEIQVFVITFCDDAIPDHMLQFSEVHNITRFRIGLTCNGHFYLVIVPMPVRMIAWSESSLVPLRTFIRIMEPVGGSEVFFAGDVYHGLLKRLVCVVGNTSTFKQPEKVPWKGKLTKKYSNG